MLLCLYCLDADLFGPGSHEHIAALGPRAAALQSPSPQRSTVLLAPRLEPSHVWPVSVHAERHRSSRSQPRRHLCRDMPCMAWPRASSKRERWTRWKSSSLDHYSCPSSAKLQIRHSDCKPIPQGRGGGRENIERVLLPFQDWEQGPGNQGDQPCEQNKLWACFQQGIFHFTAFYFRRKTLLAVSGVYHSCEWLSLLSTLKTQ